MKAVYTFVGNCGDAPIVKTLSDGRTVMECRVAVNQGYGERQKTNWVRVSLFGERGKKLSQYISKGQELFVSGELTIDEWFSNDGSKNFTMNVTAHTLELSGPSKKSHEQSEASNNVYEKTPEKMSIVFPKPETVKNDEFDEDMPF